MWPSFDWARGTHSIDLPAADATGAANANLRAWVSFCGNLQFRSVLSYHRDPATHVRKGGRSRQLRRIRLTFLFMGASGWMWQVCRLFPIEHSSVGSADNGLGPGNIPEPWNQVYFLSTLKGWSQIIFRGKCNKIHQRTSKTGTINEIAFYSASGNFICIGDFIDFLFAAAKNEKSKTAEFVLAEGEKGIEHFTLQIICLKIKKVWVGC